uniref:Axonemal dynein light chain domain containing 1 n=1 Tax=Pseudonaja textilis TaxID=8673 RepID=A0A670Y768_PSETE
MKPSGRLEVLQLMKVMDTMLEKAGTNDVNVGMHNILEVIKVEQNIYNIVFHEIIRQVSVDCAERGQLLSKLRYGVLCTNAPSLFVISHQSFFLFYMFLSYRQRYVELLERIPRQMRTLFREMMAQRVMDKHITDELFHFKQAIGQLTRELNTIREHDHRTTFEAEKAYQELARAVKESEMNTGKQYLSEERDNVIWKTFRNLCNVYKSNKKWTLEDQDAEVLVEQVEETTRERTRKSCRVGFFKMGNLSGNKYIYCFFFQMLNDELAQYGGDMLLLRQEPLKMATKLQKQWVDLGVALHGRHKDLQGRKPAESNMLEEINKDCSHLNEQYCTRVNGENGKKWSVLFERFFSKINMLHSKQKTGLYEADWVHFFQAVSNWLVQLDDLLKVTGTSETLQEKKLKTFAPCP